MYGESPATAITKYPVALSRPSFEVLRDALEDVGVKKVAAEIKKSASLVYKWIEDPTGPDASGELNPLDRCVQIMRAVGQREREEIAQFLCLAANGHFTRNPDPTHEGSIARCVYESTQDLIGETAELLQAITEAAKEEGISRDESIVIRELWEDVKTSGEGFVIGGEWGLFSAAGRGAM